MDDILGIGAKLSGTGLGIGAASTHLLSQKAQRAESLKESSLGGAAGSDSDRAVKAAKDFEALLLQQMFSTMWQAVPQNELFPEGQGTDFYRDMLNQQLAESVAEKQSLGIADMVLKDMKKRAAE